jgi:fatty-acyl-CoA synthase
VSASVQERRKAIEAAYPAWRAMTLSQALDDAAARHPDRPFVITDERTYSYAEMRDWSSRLAGGLIANGVEPNDHVALLLANYPEFVALKFAIARAGAVAVPINFLLRSAELGYVLRQCDAKLLVSMTGFRGLDHAAMLAELARGEAFPRLQQIVLLEDIKTLEHQDLSPDQGTDPDSNADVIYTSGTSGMPKGVMLSHDQLLRSAYGSVWTRAVQDGRRILFALPLYHVFAYVEGLLTALLSGGAIIPQTAFDAVNTLDAIERHHANEALFVPTMTIAVLEAARARRTDLTSLQAVMSAAAPAPVRLWRAAREELGVREVVTAYGMTETSAATTMTQPDGPLELVANTVGAPKFGGVAGDPELGGLLATYKTIDPITGEDLAPGSEGELVAKGPIITRGYYKKPAETAAALDAEGWLRSGDLGRIENRHLMLTGRSKELYKRGGELVAPKEVEEVLSGHPAVAQAYVVGLPDERMGEIGCAWVVPEADPPEPEELIDYCRANLARFKVPAHVVYISAEDLPVTATGKVQKFRLIERAKAQLEGAVR